MKSHDPAALRPQPARDGADFWPTPLCLSDALVRYALPSLHSLPPSPVWECAAGDGRLVAALRAAGRTVFASDLLPAASRTGPAAAHYLRRADVVIGDTVTGGESHAEP